MHRIRSRLVSTALFVTSALLLAGATARAQTATDEANQHESGTREHTGDRHEAEHDSSESQGAPAHASTSGDTNTHTFGPSVPTPANPDTPRDQTGDTAATSSGDGNNNTATPSNTPAVRPRPRSHRPEPEPPHRPGDPERLAVPGMTGAYFYRPLGGGRRPRVLVYLHARNANPRESCRTFHEIASRFGWLLCPIGQVDRGGGRREWNNNSDYANRETIMALDALATRFPGRVRRHDNVVMGFSEGAYVGMNVGLMNPQTFPRWFIIAADDRYIDSEGERIRRAAPLVRRVFFLTGRTDSVLDHTRRAFDELVHTWGRAHIHMRVLENAGHELPPDFVRTVRNILLWVTADPH